MVSIFMRKKVKRVTINPNKRRIVVVEPNKLPEERIIGENLEDFQKVVGGNIETTRDEKLPGMIIVVNEEGKIKGLPWNRRIKNGGAIDYISGTFFVIGDSGSDFVNLSDTQVKQAIHRFSLPKKRSSP